MAFSAKGSRRLVIDDRPYLWRVRRKPTYWQEFFSQPQQFAVRADGGTGGPLIVVLDQLRAERDWLPGPPITPAVVERCVRAALAAGWEPWSGGSELRLRLGANGERPA